MFSPCLKTRYHFLGAYREPWFCIYNDKERERTEREDRKRGKKERKEREERKRGKKERKEREERKRGKKERKERGERKKRGRGKE